jgi:CTD small phosphatase-like protein 2
VAVFTASLKCYADPIIDYLDKDKTLIQHRIYRESCFMPRKNVYIKDLRIFKGKSLKDIVIVDNAVHSFGYQILNGIPIVSFRDDKKDTEFLHLMRYFKILANVKDVRKINRKAFQLGTLCNIDIE